MAEQHIGIVVFIVAANRTFTASSLPLFFCIAYAWRRCITIPAKHPVNGKVGGYGRRQSHGATVALFCSKPLANAVIVWSLHGYLFTTQMAYSHTRIHGYSHATNTCHVIFTGWYHQNNGNVWKNATMALDGIGYGVGYRFEVATGC